MRFFAWCAVSKCGMPCFSLIAKQFRKRLNPAGHEWRNVALKQKRKSKRTSRKRVIEIIVCACWHTWRKTLRIWEALYKQSNHHMTDNLARVSLEALHFHGHRLHFPYFLLFCPCKASLLELCLLSSLYKEWFPGHYLFPVHTWCGC